MLLQTTMSVVKPGSYQVSLKRTVPKFVGIDWKAG
jgi:hypothetical protein